MVLSAPLVDAIDGAEPKLSAQVGWDETLRAARKEGAVSVYFWQGGNLDKVLQTFQQKYPDIRLAAVGGRGSGFISRIVTEMRANKHCASCANFYAWQCEGRRKYIGFCFGGVFLLDGIWEEFG